MCHAVILQYDRAINLAEDPVEAAAHPPLKAKICASVFPAHVTWPVHVLDDLANLRAALGIGWVPGARTIGDDEELLRPLFAQHGKGLCGVRRAVEDDVRDCCWGHGIEE